MSVGLKGRGGAIRRINLNFPFFFLFFYFPTCSSNPLPAHHHLPSVISTTSAPPFTLFTLPSLSLIFTCHIMDRNRPGQVGGCFWDRTTPPMRKRPS